MSAIGSCTSIFVVPVIFGSGCQPLLPPVPIPWPDICQLEWETLASSTGKEALGIVSSSLESWHGREQKLKLLQYTVTVKRLRFSEIGAGLVQLCAQLAQLNILQLWHQRLMMCEVCFQLGIAYQHITISDIKGIHTLARQVNISILRGISRFG